MVRTNTPVPVVEFRTPLVAATGLYDDHFTVAELIQQDLLHYVGRRGDEVYVRPLTRFKIFVNDVRQLLPGEILLLLLGENGQRELKAWNRN